MTAATASSPTPSESSRFWTLRRVHSGAGRATREGAAGGAPSASGAPGSIVAGSVVAGARVPGPAAAAVPAAGVASRRSTVISRVRSASKEAVCTDSCHTAWAVGPLRSTAQVGHVTEPSSGPAQDGQRVASVRVRSSIMK
jgi:hypothetical protein